MVKIFQEEVKSTVRRKRQGNSKAAVMGNEKIVIEIIDKVSNHGEAFTFHDNEGTNHGVVGKTFTSRFWVFLNERQIKIQEKGIIKLSNRLRGKKTDVLNDLLTVDSNQLLSVNLFWQLNYTIWSWLLL